jgi:hypothetical protein
MLIKQGGWVRTLELCDAVGIGKPAVMSTINDFGYNHICAQWVSKILQRSTKKPGKPSVWNFCSSVRMRVMLSCLTLSCDETCVHHYDSEMKRQSME